MTAPQIGIFALGTASHAWLEFDLLPGVDAAAAVGAVASLREPRTTIGGVNLVCGFRPELWGAVAKGTSPAGLTGFNDELPTGAGSGIPATQHDVVIWLTGSGYDVVFDLTRSVVMGLSDVASLRHELTGWPYHHDRDLTGFIDGTENPSVVEATQVALVAEGQPGAGGSVLLLQQWEHDALEWERFPVEVQEQIIGRRKVDSEELDPRPETSHVARTDQDDFGKIFRRNIAYGTLSQHGTIFVGFCHERTILQRMLESMVGRDGDSFDRLTSVTRCLTSAYYWVPSADDLTGFGSEPAATA